MQNTLQLNINNRTESIPFTLSLLFTSILMHQSSVMFGVNLSLADFFCLFIVLTLVIQKQFLIPISPLLFFFGLSILVMVTASFYIPGKYFIHVRPVGVASDYMKLVASFVYFLIGYNLSQLNLIKKTVKWYSMFGLLIGAVGIVLTLLNIGLFRDLLFFAGTRFRGLMIDPNYFSVLQITSLVYVTRSTDMNTRFKYLAIMIILLSVLTSGSKTGMVTLGCYFSFRLVEYLFLTRKKLAVLIGQLFLITFIALLAPVALQLLGSLLNGIASSIPSFGRVYFLLTDFGAAVSEGGSGREATWVAAFQVIQLSPLIGVGIGTYTAVANELFNYNNVAHNTFLQLSAEWGIPMAIGFFFYVIYLLGKVTFWQKQTSDMNLILRDVILILLIGSMAISLNNARMLWLFLGAFVFMLNNPMSKRVEKKLEKCLLKISTK